MLEVLSISNYALIENLEFHPGEGFSILTGDTGAGKSIMLKALSLLGGERADSGMIGDKSKKATVEAIFVNPARNVAEVVKEIDPEWEGESIIIRREIAPSGRSRAYLNDSPVSLAQLTSVSNLLFDIHSQNATSSLSDPQFQLDLVDAFSDLQKQIREYRTVFSDYVALRHEIKDFHTKRDEFQAKKEIIEFKLNKINELNPKEGELETLEKKFEVLSNSVSLKGSLSEAHFNLSNEEGDGAIDRLRRAATMLSSVDFSVLNEEMKDFNSRLSGCLIELKDLAGTLENFIEDMEIDPATLERMEFRINDYNRVIKELNLESEVELLRLWDNLKRDLTTFDSDTGSIEKKERRARALAIELKEKASEISVLRKEGAKRLERRIEEEARKLGLENISFKIDFQQTKIGKHGGDSVEFMVSINKNQPLSPLSRTASGGEMARLMLVIKKITAEKIALPTIIFDEIDTGVSGRIADKMGEMMKEMGSDMQILAITHLPQVASKGKCHFKVYKTDLEDKTVSDIRLLDKTEREKEIARMLSGKNINDIALENARHLLSEE